MGASSWAYWVAYQDDVGKALHDLQQQVLEKEQFLAPFGWYDGDFDDDETEEGLDFEPLPDSGPAPDPNDKIAVIRYRAGTDGTHSILDIVGVAREPLVRSEDEFAEVAPLVYPLSDEDQRLLFEGQRPRREEIDACQFGLLGLCPSWTGIYTFAYEDGAPTEILFIGWSGD